MQTHPIVLGTAGHIDHGKTSLVKTLTGIDTDRLKEEKERGITTELGFAHLDLGGRRFGVVDVPGHERFIKAMVAGAGGLDLVCLVIAADEGIMPQTREHLDICELLGVRLGVVVLTKADLVDDEWLELVQSEIRDYLADSFLAEAPMVAVSAHTGQGMDTLKEALVERTQGLATRDPDGPFRLPVDRVFSIKGFGTVVTGTVIGGQCQVGEELVLVPGGLVGKVRGVQVHGEDSKRARAGVRAAINLSGLGVDDIHRGDALVRPGEIEASHIIDVRFRYLASSKHPLKARSRVLLHHGSSQRMAALHLVDKALLEPGQTCLAQLRLEHSDAIAALPGDHFILRGFEVQKHYGTTIGGGEVLRVLAPKVKPSATDAKEALVALASAHNDADTLEHEIAAGKVAGRRHEDLAKRTGFPSQRLGAALQAVVESGAVVRSGKGKAAVYLHASQLARLEKRAVDKVTEFHKSHPEQRGMSRAELANQMPPSLPDKLFAEVIASLVQRSAVHEEGDVVFRPGQGTQRAGLSELEERISANFSEWANTPPKPSELPSKLSCSSGEAQKAIQRLVTLGVLVKVATDLYLHKDAIDSLEQALQQHFVSNDELTTAQWKDITGTSRKYAIPLAEYFDREKVTLRVGDVRKKRN